MADAIVSAQFLYESAAFPSCHAGTLAEVPGGLLAAYFGGTHERHPDVCIYTSRFDGQRWAEPVEVADGIQPDGSRQPCWNPVLFQPREGPLLLFYKVGPNPREWWGMVKRSTDAGHTWSTAERLPDGILGPIKNKPVQLDNGDILSPASIEGPDIGWRIYFERSRDGGRTWQAGPWIDQDPAVKAIQPSILIHSPMRLQALGRTKSGQMFSTFSDDGGHTWQKLALIDLPNPNSGTDAVTLADGRHLLAYNHSGTEKVRVPLNIAVSSDGDRWAAAVTLESEPPGQYSYPAIIQSANGLVHVLYTWKRLKMKHVILDPAALSGEVAPKLRAGSGLG